MRRIEPTVASISALKPGPIRHSSLPEALLVRIRLIHAVLPDAEPMDLDEMLTNVQCDVDPASDVSVWEHMACAYLIALQHYQVPRLQYGALFAELLRVSMSCPLGSPFKRFVERLDKTSHRRMVARMAASTARSSVVFKRSNDISPTLGRFDLVILVLPSILA